MASGTQIGALCGTSPADRGLADFDEWPSGVLRNPYVKAKLEAWEKPWIRDFRCTNRIGQGQTDATLLEDPDIEDKIVVQGNANLTLGTGK